MLRLKGQNFVGSFEDFFKEIIILEVINYILFESGNKNIIRFVIDEFV